ncbi:lipopolysaccharide heptosyltransferase II [Arsenophonus symbiont of Ornithomya chloropus]|uniref:lipopolysaccharide heptosyltransferase II n=1 Tax=Arsenophonus symbiont of Ornithomya chloropus TaxID=634121 RepID=UPI0032B30602
MKVLVIAPTWVGDMMMTHSLFRTLKALYSNIIIDVMASNWCYELLKKMPEVNNSILMPLNRSSLEFFQRHKIGINLRKKKYDKAYILPNSFKSALIPFFANIPLRIGWCGENRYWLINDMRFLNIAEFPQMVQRYIALAYPKDLVNNADSIPKPILWPKISVSDAERIKSKKIFYISNKLPIIGICPGAASGFAKCWPYYHYAKLTELLYSIYGYQILIFGSQQDYNIGYAIWKLLSLTCQNNCVNLVGKTSLNEVANLLASCTAVVTNDSGLMHIAAALNIPIVALYGPTNPNFTPPLSNRVKIIHVAIKNHKTRIVNKNNRYHKSLINIKPVKVINELINLLELEYYNSNASINHKDIING